MSAALLLMTVAAAPLDSAAGWEMNYQGSVTQTRKNTAASGPKEFNAYCLVTPADDAKYDVTFVVDELGGGAWPWPERFGRFTRTTKPAKTEESRMAVLHTHDGHQYPIPLPGPIFQSPKALADGVSFESGKNTYKVSGEKKRLGRDCWRIDVSTNFGQMRTYYVEKETGVVVEATQKVFMGRGDQFQVTTKLVKQQALTADRVKAMQPAATALLRMQEGLKRKQQDTRETLSDAQLKVAGDELKTLPKLAKASPFAPLVEVIEKDVKGQLRRDEDVTALAKRFLGKPASAFKLPTLDVKTIDSKNFKDRIVVLHFWKYHDDPLSEPYGQVGYLDFLNGKRKKLGVDVIGVAVDAALGDPLKKGPTRRAVNKLVEFMNVDYPIALDDEATLKLFGDPRRVGANLPLWVVIDPAGKIAYYKTGFLPVTKERGLEELDDVVIKLIRAKRTGK